jgi:hypothetical protein
VDKVTSEAYVTGWTDSTDFPITLGAFQSFNAGGGDVFLTKLKADGSGLIYSTYLGGSSADNNNESGIAIDAAGNAYVTGSTRSTDFPILNAVQPTYSGGGGDVFVTELNASGSALVFSTYLGGSSDDSGQGIAVDRSGNVYVTGSTYSNNFPTTKGAYQTKRGGNYNDAFVTKISAAPALLAASSAPGISSGTMATPPTLLQVQPLLDEALPRWLAAGVDVSTLHGVEIRIADLGGATLGTASGNTIWLDDNAAGWGWFIDSTPTSDSEFVAPGNQGEQNHMDLLTVEMHELGHLLGYKHEDTGVMSGTLAAGSRQSPGHDAIDSLFALSTLEDNNSLSAISTPDVRRKAH